MNYLKLFILLIGFNQLANAQKGGNENTESKYAVVMPENEHIASVNIDQDVFIEKLVAVNDIVKSHFDESSDDQKVALLITTYPDQEATVLLKSSPELEGAKYEQIMDEIGEVSFGRTNYAVFPIAFLVNTSPKTLAEDFPEFKYPSQIRDEKFESYDLKGKVDFIKAYAANSLNILAAYQTSVDDQFAGVKNFGNLVAQTDFTQAHDIAALTNANNDYWRATLEMAVGNQLIPITKAFMLASQGELDYAKRYIEILFIFSDDKSVAHKYMDQLYTYMTEVYKIEQDLVNEGIELHDAGEYENAIEVYNQVLEGHPNSAWAHYEIYYSQSHQDFSDARNKELWKESKPLVMGANPLYHLDPIATSGEQAYLMFRRQEIQTLFKSREALKKDLYTYATIAMELEVYEFAAQVFWLSATYDKERNEDARLRMLYCLEKTGAKEIKNLFKDKFPKEFKKIEKEMQKEMEESPFYQAF